MRTANTLPTLLEMWPSRRAPRKPDECVVQAIAGKAGESGAGVAVDVTDGVAGVSACCPWRCAAISAARRALNVEPTVALRTD